MNENINVTQTKKKNPFTAIIIVILILIILGLCGYIAWDKVLKDKIMPNNNTTTTTSTTTTEKVTTTQVVDEKDFDMTKFDDTKLINKISGVTYTYEIVPSTVNVSVDAKVNDNKKSVEVKINWADYSKIYDDESLKDKGTLTYTVTGFKGNVRKVYVSGYGQGTGYETIYYVMEDGTVEFTGIADSLSKNGPTNNDALKISGKIDNVTGVTQIAYATSAPKDSEYGAGLAVIGVRTDGSFYDLSRILDTTYYNKP